MNLFECFSANMQLNIFREILVGRPVDVLLCNYAYSTPPLFTEGIFL